MSTLVRTTQPVELVPATTAGTLAAHVGPFLNTLKYVRERSEHTVMAYGHDLATFLRFCNLAGLETPDQVKAKHIELYVAWLRQERGAAKATAKRHLSCLREFWRFLEREEITTRNPAATAYGPNATRRMPVYLKIHEQEALLEVMVRDHSPIGQRDYAIVGVMLLAGLRVSEVVNLRLEDVDLEGSTIRVRHAKGDRDREVPLIPRLRGMLRAYLSDGRPRLKAAGEAPWFFLVSTTRGGGKRNGGRNRRLTTPTRGAAEPLLTRSVYRIIRYKVSPIVGRKLHPHVLRHSFASRLRENDAPIELVQEALGHSNLATTMVYAHLSTAKRMRDLTKHLEGA
jgi:site-specific recombinase XerD